MANEKAYTIYIVKSLKYDFKLMSRYYDIIVS